MICPKCRGYWVVKQHDGRLHNVCEKCGYVDLRNGTVDGTPIGPSSPRLDSDEHFAFEQQRKEIERLRADLAAAKALLREALGAIYTYSLDGVSLHARIRATLRETQ